MDYHTNNTNRDNTVVSAVTITNDKTSNNPGFGGSNDTDNPRRRVSIADKASCAFRRHGVPVHAEGVHGGFTSTRIATNECFLCKCACCEHLHGFLEAKASNSIEGAVCHD